MIIKDTSIPDIDSENAHDKKYISDLFSQPAGDLSTDAFKYTSSNRNVDLVIAGCSFTYGVGVDKHESWGALLGGKLELDYVNISNRGWSMIEIVEGVFSHIKRYGNPKYVAVLATQLTRGRDPIDGIEVCSDSSSNPGYREVCTIHLSLSKGPTNKTVAKYSKKPHRVEDTTFSDSYVYRSITAINTLINYCRAANIKMVWGTWDIKSSNLYRFVSTDRDLVHIDLGNYVELPVYIGLDDESYMERYCSAVSHGDLYDIGSDNGAHAGSHYHLHWSDAFYSRLVNI